MFKKFALTLTVHSNYKRSFHMKVLVAACALVAFCCGGVSYGSMPDDPEDRHRFALLKMIEYCDLVVQGTVSSMDYVVRRGVMPDGGGAFTTDITLQVDEVLKGKPNAGKDKVKFMIMGGEGIDPRTGEKLTLLVTHVPEFAVDEKVVVFLKQGDPDDPGSFARNYPHGRYKLVAGEYGKRPIKNGKIGMLYGNVDNPTKLVEMPVTLAVKLGKAANKDKEAAILLENVIKRAAFAETANVHTLTASMIDDLKRRAKSIVDAPAPRKK